ncbi:prostatic spermine-binding protein-like [Trifolium pratense]|uniref:Uncharacterized protein n=1 Tax=Trifolium pratense TaxID=57577 RepID=A0ACB0K7Q3_TRIPR|nr:prostatic spermine-binding protein-like [Trifolium pratense]CAJ2651783.1 unnamed protein product [Trifolium pratense]
METTDSVKTDAVTEEKNDVKPEVEKKDHKTDAKKDDKKDDKTDEKKHEKKDEKNDEIKDVGRGADDKNDGNSTSEEEEFDANKMDDAVRTSCNVGLSPTQQTILQFPQYFDAGEGSNERFNKHDSLKTDSEKTE